eukprot:10397490-Alexandrium_andersonii.AAC.1
MHAACQARAYGLLLWVWAVSVCPTQAFILRAVRYLPSRAGWPTSSSPCRCSRWQQRSALVPSSC